MRRHRFNPTIVTITIGLFLWFSPVKLTSTEFKNLIINDVTTSIDVSTQLVNVEYKLSLISKQNNVRSLIFTVDPALINNVAYITAKGKVGDLNKPLRKLGNDNWRIMFQYPLAKGQVEHITVYVIYTHVLKSFPTKIKQNEKHLVLFSGPVSLYSPYLSINHTSFVKLGNGVIETVAPPKNFTLIKTSQLLTFSSQKPIEPYMKTHSLIHYEHKIPFLAVKELHRTIEVSHWGCIKLVEEILLENVGAKLYGPYHRQFLNDKESNNKNRYFHYDEKGNSIKSFTTILPASATDISIYDDIGVVSSFKIKSKVDCVEIEIYPRYYLYGGWKIKYFLAYSVPSYEYMFNNDNDYIIKMRAIDHVFNDMVIENAFVHIVLPEGTKQITLKAPYAVQTMNQSYHFSYLDTIGKPVLSFTKENLVEQHIQDFIVSYEFNQWKMLLEPLYIIVFIQIIFSMIIISSRFQFSLVKEDMIENIKPVCAVEKTVLEKHKRKKH